MKILPEKLSDNPKFQSHFPEARSYTRENRVYNLKESEGELKAYVLGSEPMPHETVLRYRKEEGAEGQYLWSCECASDVPCVHLAALIIKSSQSTYNAEHWLMRLASKLKVDPDSLNKPLVSGEGSSLFGDDLFGGAEERSVSQYSIESISGKTTGQSALNEDIPLFQGIGEDDFLLQQEAPRYDLIFTLTPSKGEGVLVRPALIRLREGIRSGGIARYKASRPILPPSAQQSRLLKLLCAEEEEALPLERCLETVLEQKELCTTAKNVLKVINALTVNISFHFQELLGDERPLYYPEFCFRGKNSNGDEDSYTLMDPKKLIIRGGRVFCLDEKEALLVVLKEDSNTSFFLNLLLSKSQGFLAADIQGVLRLARDLGKHCLRLDEHYPPVSIRQADAEAVLKMRSRQDKTELFFFFRYGKSDIAYQDQTFWLPPEDPEGAAVLTIQKRNRVKEAALVKKVVEHFTDHLSFEKGYYARLVNENRDGDLRLDISLEEFLAFYARSLHALGVELQLEDRKISSSGSVRFNVKGGKTDWLEVDAMMEDPDTEELRSLFFDDHFQTLGLINTGNSYIKLKDSQLRQLEYLRRQGMNDDGQLEASAVNFSLVDHIYDQVVNREDSPVEDVLSQARELRDTFEGDTYAQPAQVQATLRPYQLTGYNWLRKLHEMNCAGCLADDMGLGKTLQTLCLLQSLKDKGELKTNLLVAPVVTLANWEQEIKKFTPGLSFYRHAGTDRHNTTESFKQYDIVIVSYHTLRNDVDLFLDMVFDYIILDEAHYIKNASSIIFKAIRSLKSHHRLSLTGTPIENNTLELWSQFNFLSPGLLGSQKDFISRFAHPIEKKHDNEALTILRDTVSPFILRRKKEDVLDDIPPKEIIIHYSEMTGSQAELYRKYRDFYRARVKGLLDEKGLSGSSMEIFQFLLKLRQIAIYPPMAGVEGAEAGSCKMDALKSFLDDVMVEDHKILIFSQFLGSLSAMGDHCRNQHWDYSLITGKTADRAEEIRRFQEEEDVKIFLLSLKAGGVGINLTAADYVVLFDPWWNPAAERQAIDRAHRMGQTRKVISYKMIVRDTIEEKILKMQEEKTALMEGIISDEQNFFGSLKEDELVKLFE
ncbi:MAG: hypothetical protein B6241_09300 [Spirochaetaceae bacterium 4572_59]|nr:MAG: hypothetical protein B6241_09300 [Spirochaetaceae bacterium 4572_59]